MDFIKPKRLRNGQCIGIIAPSLPSASIYHDRFATAVRALSSTFGSQVKIAPHVNSAEDYTGTTPEVRAEDLNNFIRDPNIAAIFTVIGGFNSNQLLPFIDFKAAKTHCKIFVGYSDTTALLTAFNCIARWTCFYGPATLSQFGEYPTILEYTRANLVKALCHAEPLGQLADPDYFTTELLDWSSDESKTRARRLEKFPGREILKSGSGTGVLFGGNIETLNFIIGTRWWKPPKDMVLFLEATGEEAYLPRLERSLTHLRQAGLFDAVRGFLLGYKQSFSPCDGIDVDKVIRRQLADYDFPIVVNLPFGHSDPIATLPIGAKVQVSAHTNGAEVVFSESATSD